MLIFFNPVKIYFAPGLMGRLQKDLLTPDRQIKRVLLLSGNKSLKESGYHDLILRQLHFAEVLEYNGVPSNPGVEDLFEIKRDTEGFGYDSIFAAGGGSVLDTGKFLAAFKGIRTENPRELRESIIKSAYRGNKERTRLFAAPTTAGTGSEVTCWATVWDREEGKKYSIEDHSLYPGTALVDPLLTVNLPMHLTAATALDALSHAVEAYWSKRSNEIVRMYAVKAVEIICRGLDALLDDLHNIELRTRIAFASLNAGLAFSNTKTTACHSISYPLTLMHGMEHGFAVGLTLGKMLMINERALIDKRRLFSALGVQEAHEVDLLIKRFFQKAGIPFRLRDYGVSRQHLPVISGNAFTPGRMDNNPVEITRETLSAMLESIF